MPNKKIFVGYLPSLSASLTLGGKMPVFTIGNINVVLMVICIYGLNHLQLV